jgi:hypothetical protein
MSEPFFSRWSRRKQEAEVGRALDEPKPTAAPAIAPRSPEPSPDLPGPVSKAAHAAPEADEAPLPGLEDAQALDPSSDFQPFMRRGVSPDVRNVAMKKLFADPHFNVMDGLDIYIGDYTQPDPLPTGMLEQMVGAQFLNLVPPTEAKSQGAGAPVDAKENPDQSPQTQQAPPVVAQSPDSAAPMAVTHTDHDHTDLQLQPDPAAAGRQAGAGPR